MSALTRVALTSFVVLLAGGCAATSNRPISSEHITAAQNAWGQGLVAIGAATDPKAEAERVIDSLYAYAGPGVLFKPTLTFAPQTFRNTRESALAYFVGGNPAFPDDNGFALKPWTAFRFDNFSQVVEGNIALTMGNVTLTGADGSSVTVDKTFVYHRGDDGQLRIVLHHSSLPFAPQ